VAEAMIPSLPEVVVGVAAARGQLAAVHEAQLAQAGAPKKATAGVRWRRREWRRRRWRRRGRGRPGRHAAKAAGVVAQPCQRVGKGWWHGRERRWGRLGGVWDVREASSLRGAWQQAARAEQRVAHAEVRGAVPGRRRVLQEGLREGSGEARTGAVHTRRRLLGTLARWSRRRRRRRRRQHGWRRWRRRRQRRGRRG